MADAAMKAAMEAGIARHPEYYNTKIHPDMRLPADTRKLRDVKIKEVPSWLMKRDWSGMGVYFSAKRFLHRFNTRYTYVRKPGGNLLFVLACWGFIGSYIFNYKYIKHEKLRKYH